MGKTERQTGNGFTELAMPPFSSCALCRQRMNEVCLEKCAPSKDYSEFELREGINLDLAPRFPMKEFVEQMPPKVRQIVVAAYISLMVDHLQGRVSYARPIVNRSRKADDGSRNNQTAALVEIATLQTNADEDTTGTDDL
jgi:hypothetical protein